MTGKISRLIEKHFFPSPAEVRLVQVLGGTTMTFYNIRFGRFQRPLTLIISRGRVLRREHFKRTGDTLILFSNDLKWALALEGSEYERDVVAAYNRDEELAQLGWRIKYIRVRDLMHNPAQVRRNVQQFLT